MIVVASQVIGWDNHSSAV